MKKIAGIITALILLITALGIGIYLYVFSPIGTGLEDLNEKQEQSLCEQFTLGEKQEERYGLPLIEAAAVKIYGVEKSDDTAYVYGYCSNGIYVKFRGKAYDISGGNGDFKVKIKYNGDNVEILESYGDGVTAKSTLEESPLRYKIKSRLYEPYDSEGHCKLKQDTDKKAEAELGVPVETEYNLTIDIENNYYQISTYNDETGEVDYKEKGSLKKNDIQ